jgi:hypothetical protein
MNIVKTTGIVLALAVSSAAFPQQSGNAPENGGAQTGTQTQPGQAGQNMNAPAAQGTPGNQSGSLMDKRANALSPNSASSPARTGEIKQ